MDSYKTIELLGIKFSNISFKEILDSIQLAIQNHTQLSICYANVNSINQTFENRKLKKLFSEFDIVHQDGFGVFLASKLLFGTKGFSIRQSGSDFYEILIKFGIERKLKFFIFGDTDETLGNIKTSYPALELIGLQNGYFFENDKILIETNKSNPDILIVGMGTPKQEEWIVTNRDKINTKVIIAVGDGIKIFAGNKRRGPKWIQRIGLEWLVRLFFEPKRLWKRYIIGIPLFIFRVIKFKLLNSKNG